MRYRSLTTLLVALSSLLASVQASGLPLVVKSRSQLSLSLDKAGADFSLRVTLRDDADQPLGNARVTLTVVGNDSLVLITDAQGRITVSQAMFQAQGIRVQQQEYTVMARYAGDAYHAAHSLARRFNFGPDLVTLRFDALPQLVALDRASLSLRVLFSCDDGNTVGHTITLQMAHWPAPLSAVTDVSGAATFVLGRSQFPAPGKHTVTAIYAGTAQYQRARTSEVLHFARTTLVSLTAHLNRPQDKRHRELVLSGQLLAGGRPLPNRSLALRDRGRRIGRVTTDASGKFTRHYRGDAIPTGDLQLVARFVPEAAGYQVGTSPVVRLYVAPFPTIPLRYYLLPLAFLAAALTLLGLKRIPWRAMAQWIVAQLRRPPKRTEPAATPLVETGHQPAPDLLQTPAVVETQLIGQLYDADSALPVIGGQLIVMLGDRVERQAVSDARGWFRIDDLPHGRITLSISHPGFLDEQLRLRIPHDGSYCGFRLNLTSLRLSMLNHYRRLLRETYPAQELWGRATPRELIRLLMDRIPKGHDRLAELTRLFEQNYFGEQPPSLASWQQFTALSDAVRKANPEMTWRYFLASCLTLFCTAQIDAAPRDYGTQPGPWNNLSQLTEIARRVGVELSFQHELDWRRVLRRDVLLFVYPKAPLPRSELDRFLRDGGRIIIADDFGKADSYLKTWGLTRVAPPIKARRTYQGMPKLPLLEPTRTHFLFTFIKYIITNHPVAYRDSSAKWEILQSFLDPRDGFLLERKIDRGRLLVLSDPSVLINLMLEFDDNFQFVANLSLYYCHSRPCRLRVVLPEANFSGAYTAQSSDLQSLRQFLKTTIAKLNHRIRRLNHTPASELPLYLFSVICLIGVLLMLTSGVLGRALPSRFGFQKDHLQTRSDFGLTTQLLAHNRERADFAEQMLKLSAVIATQLAKRGFSLADAAGRADAAHRLSHALPGSGSASQLLEAFTVLRAIEDSVNAQLTYRFVSYAEFDRIFQLCRPVLEVFADER